MYLPGGLWHDGTLLRELSFRPLTGAVERKVGEVFQTARTKPDAATDILAAVLQHVGGLEPASELIDALSVGDRRFLMIKLLPYLGQDEVWMSAECEGCAERFDFQIRFSDLPIKPAGAPYPFCRVETSLGAHRWRVPTGADQKALALVPPETDDLRFLLHRCLVDGEGRDNPDHGADLIARLSPEDLYRIEAGIEQVAPEVVDQVQTSCFSCGQINRIGIDPYICIHRGANDLYFEIHTIATVYHWSEAEILSLPKQNRRQYLKMIDRARGMTG